ncbi:MAG: hypothetical protein LBV70_07290 [Candidatus Adiutrix sp.]|nr:hypothetical protein [Candidatus Adiutrix sp.]
MNEPDREILYLAEGGRRVAFRELYFELREIYDAASGLQLLVEELAADLTDDGYEPARYLMARLTVRHALERIDRLLPRSDWRGRGFHAREGEIFFAGEPSRA